MLLGDDWDISLKTLNDFPNLKNLAIEETGGTYEKNASLKASVVADMTGLPTLADDSGLEVEALDDFPGINSARWMPGSDQERNLGLLKKMLTIKNRSAQFVSVLCFVDPQEHHQFCVEGVMKGTIGKVQRGSNGFGYDPLFIPEGFSKTFAELSSKQKNSISHRALAVQKLVQMLQLKYGKLKSEKKD